MGEVQKHQEKITPNVEKTQNSEEQKAKVENKTKELSKSLSNSDIDVFMYSSDLKKIKEEWKEWSKKLSDILHPEEWVKKWNEKVSEKLKTRADILKENLDVKIQKTLSEWQTIDSIAGVIKKADWTNFETKEKAKEFLREQFLNWEIKSLNIEKIIEKDWKKITITEKQKILERNSDIKEVFWNIEDVRFQNEMLVMYGEEKVKTFSAVFLQLRRDWKDLPKNIDELNNIIIDKIVVRRVEEELSISQWDIDVEKTKKEAVPIAEKIVKSGSSKQLANATWTLWSWYPFVARKFDSSELNKSYEKWKILDQETKEKLNKIYNTESNNDKRMLDTIEKLSDHKSFKKNVAEFLIDAYKTYWKKITQANWNLGWVRSLKQQSDIINKWGWATKIKNPANSKHTQWTAIDLNIAAWNLKLVQLWAKHWLWNWQEMWWWDHVHFQSEYSWSWSKKAGRLARMKSRGTLPVEVIT